MNINAQDVVNELARLFPKELEIATQALIIRELESKLETQEEDPQEVS
jgi:rRNA-processing protein FCF1